MLTLRIAVGSGFLSPQLMGLHDMSDALGVWVILCSTLLSDWYYLAASM